MTDVLAAIPFPSLDPVALRVGPLAIRWYGLAYLTAFALGYVFLRKLARSGRLRVAETELPDLLLFLVAGVMLGGRAGWWFFYHRGYGDFDPWYEPVALWHGGMSFHGGLLGVTGALLAWTWRAKAPFWNVADCLALATPVGLFFGRIANFINAELVGRESSLPWAVVFPGDPVARHPSQLYEALLEGPVLLALLWALTRRRQGGDGRLAAAFLIGYGVLRFLVEFTREPDSELGFIAFGWLTTGQLLSAALVLAGAALFAWLGRRPPDLSSGAGLAPHRPARPFDPATSHTVS